jgi:RNA polymerase sigma-70 factor (ECF subfamily)
MKTGGIAVTQMSGDGAAGTPAWRESFDAFYLREFAPMVTLAYAVSGSRSAAEDLAQEAMIRANRNWDRISKFDKPGAWVRRVTIHLAVSSLRRRSAEMRALLRLGPDRGSIPGPDEGPDTRVWEAVGRLPRQQRAAVALFYLEDRSTEEIASILGCSESTARVHLHRGRSALAAALGPDHQEGR